MILNLKKLVFRIQVQLMFINSNVSHIIQLRIIWKYFFGGKNSFRICRAYFFKHVFMYCRLFRFLFTLFFNVYVLSSNTNLLTNIFCVAFPIINLLCFFCWIKISKRPKNYDPLHKSTVNTFVPNRTLFFLSPLIFVFHHICVSFACSLTQLKKLFHFCKFILKYNT